LAEEGFCSNDLTGPVTRRHPIIAELVAALRAAGALAAEMTGSGSAVYGVFPESAGGLARTAALLAEEYPCTRWLSTRIVDVGK
jgi:4-diphosphocytidyl-2C-methyl-D-erythritol kinase